MLQEPVVVAAEHSTVVTAAEAVESSAVSYMQAWEVLVMEVVDQSLRLVAVLAGRRMKGSLLLAAVAELVLVAASVGVEFEAFDSAGYPCSALESVAGAATTGTTRPLIQSTQGGPARWAPGLIPSEKAVDPRLKILSMASHPKWHRHRSLECLCLAAQVPTPKG